MRITLFLLAVISALNCIYKPDLGVTVRLDLDRADYLFTNVGYFSGKPGSKLLRPVNVLVSEGIIKKNLKNPIAAGKARVMNAPGHTLIPSLVDAHTHVMSAGTPPWMSALIDPRQNLAAFAYSGVLAVMDMMGDAEDINELNEEENNPWPRVFHSGRAFTVDGGHPSYMIRERVPWILESWVIGNLLHEIKEGDDTYKLLQENIRNKASYAKVYLDQIPLGIPEMKGPLLRALADAAQTAGVTLFAHIGTEQHIELALDNGIRHFVHGPYRSDLSVKTLKKMKEKRTVMMPTAVIWESIALLAEKKMRFNDLAQVIHDPKVKGSYVDSKAIEGLAQGERDWIELVRKNRDLKFKHLRNMYKKGIKLIAASDSPNVGVAAGEGIHREMRLWVENAGIKPLEALSAATWVPGELLGNITGVKGYGQLVEGGPANLVLVQGDPSKDITATQKIAMVLKEGRRVIRETVSRP